MNLETLSIDKIRAVIEKKGYVWFDDKKPYNLNLIYVRSKNRTADLFDDTRFLIYRDVQLNWRMHSAPCTTDPGLFWLKNPMDPSVGAGIQGVGQVRGAYKVGLHLKKFTALIQQVPFPYYRDNNRDDKLNLDPKSYVSIGVAKVSGFNSHSVSSTFSQKVGNISAGCFDEQERASFAHLLACVSMQEHLHGWDTVTRTLIDEVDFE